MRKQIVNSTLIVLILLLFPAQKGVAQTSCTVSGVTINVSGSSSGTSMDPTLNSSGCPSSPYAGLGFGNGNGTSGFLIYTFSAPVTSARVIYSAVNSAVGPGNGFDLGVITTSAGTPSLSNPCGVAIVNGNRIIGGNTNGPLGEAYVTVSSSTPFTWIRLVNSADGGSNTTGFGQGNPCDFTVVPLCQVVIPTTNIPSLPSCSTPSGSFVINPQSGFEYAVDSGAYQSSNSFSGIAPGPHTIKVRSIYNSSCAASNTITIAAVPSSPSYPNSSSMTNPSCANPSSGSITITPQTGVEYSLDGVRPYQTSNAFTGLSAGTYVLKVRSTTDNSCTAATAGYTLVLNQPAGISYTSKTDPKCDMPTGSFTFATQPNVQYSIDNGANYFPNPAFTGLAPNTNLQLKVRSTIDITCTNAAVVSPIGGPATSPSNPTSSSGTNPTCANPSSGSITITPQTGVEYSLDGVRPYQTSNVFTGLSAGSYVLKVRKTSDNSCTATTAGYTFASYQPSGIGYTSLIQPTCAKPSGSYTFATQPNVDYSINDGMIYYPSPNFSGIQPNTTLRLKVRSTIDKTCTNSAIITINALTPPFVPMVSNIEQPSCTNPKGTIHFASQPNAEYSLNNGAYQSSPTFSGLTAGSYSIRVRNATGDTSCSSAGFQPEIINAAPVTPVANAGADFTKTCNSNILGARIGVAGVAGVTYSWSPATGLSNPSVSRPIANPTATTEYTLTATNTASGCQVTDKVLVTVTGWSNDCDGDTLTNEEEEANGTDPNKKDTDGNGTTDNLECSLPIYTTVTWDNHGGTLAATYFSSNVNSSLNQVFGSGLTASTYAGAGSRQFANIDATTMAQAKTNNEYVEYGFSVKNSTTLRTLKMFRENITSNYRVGVEISNNNFSSSTPINTGYTIAQVTGDQYINTSAYTLLSGVTYKLRVYFYGSATVLDFDDFQVLGNVINSCDTDGDSVVDVSDLDDDNDGIVDIVECTNPLTSSIEWTNSSLRGELIPYYPSSKNVATASNQVFGSGLTQVHLPAPINSRRLSNIDALTLNQSMDNDEYVEYGFRLNNTTLLSNLQMSRNSTTSKYYVSVFISKDNFVTSTILSSNVTPPQAAGPYTIPTTTFKLLSGLNYKVRVYFYGSAVIDDFDDFEINADPLLLCDTDLDGILNIQDLDSDGDGCTDAIEGSGSFSVSDLKNSSLAGGNTGWSYNGTATNPVTYNLGNTVGTSGSTLGVPTIASSGQGIGTSLSKSSQDTSCTTANLAVSQTATPACIGSTVTFTVTARNNGPSTATNVLVNDVLPSGYTFVSAVPTVGTYSNSVWTIPTLTNGATASIAINATVLATGIYKNDVSISSFDYDPVLSNNTATLTPTVTTLPTANAGTNFTKTCVVNPTGLQVGATGVFGIDYTWTASTGTAPTGPNPTVNPITTTTYTLTATNPLSGCKATATVEVTVDITKPVANAGSNFTKTCVDNPTGKIIGDTAVLGVDYSWIPATGLSSATLPNPKANPTATTSYTLTATKKTSGCTASSSVVVTVDTVEPPTPSLTATTIANACPAMSVNLNSLVSNTTNLKWYADKSRATEVTNPSAVTTTGTYYPFYINTVNGCYSKLVSTGVTATITAVPDVPSLISPPIHPTCAVTTGTIAFTVQAGLYQYSIDNFATVTTTSPISGLAPGDYTLKVRSANNTSCANQSASPIKINAVPTKPSVPTLAATPIQPTCGSPTGTIVFTTQPNVTYSIDNGLTYQNSETFSGLLPATYTLKVINPNDSSCIASGTLPIIIVAAPLPPGAPTISSMPKNNVCPAAKVNLNSFVTTSSSSGTLLWYTNNTHTGTVVTTPETSGAGTYYAFYNTTINCYSPASVPVTVTITDCCATEIIN